MTVVGGRSARDFLPGNGGGASGGASNTSPVDDDTDTVADGARTAPALFTPAILSILACLAASSAAAVALRSRSLRNIVFFHSGRDSSIGSSSTVNDGGTELLVALRRAPAQSGFSSGFNTRSAVCGEAGGCALASKCACALHTTRPSTTLKSSCTIVEFNRTKTQLTRIYFCKTKTIFFSFVSFEKTYH